MDAQGMTTSANVSVLGTAVLNATSIVADTLTIGGTPIVASQQRPFPNPALWYCSPWPVWPWPALTFAASSH